MNGSTIYLDRIEKDYDMANIERRTPSEMYSFHNRKSGKVWGYFRWNGVRNLVLVESSMTRTIYQDIIG